MTRLEYKHGKLLSTVKPVPPKRYTPNTNKNSLNTFPKPSKVHKSGSHNKNFIRIEEVDPNEANVKIEEVPITIPQFEKKSSKLKVSKLEIAKISLEKQSNTDRVSCTSKGKSIKKSLQKMKGLSLLGFYILVRLT